jgi:hypothetical protein
MGNSREPLVKLLTELPSCKAAPLQRGAPALQVPSPVLFSFQRFEQGFEIACSETFAAVAADYLIKYGWTILDGLAENLE